MIISQKTAQKTASYLLQVKAVLREVDENGKAKLEFEKGKMISFNTTELKIPYTI